MSLANAASSHAQTTAATERAIVALETKVDTSTKDK
jgi:hypothetical protein